MSSESNYPTGVTRDKPTSIEAIRRYYMQPEDSRHPIELTTAQEAHRQQLVSAHTQLVARRSEEQVREFLRKEYGLSDSTSFRRVREALELFGDMKKASKEGRRHIVYEMALYAFQVAEEDRNADAMNKAVSNMIALLGLTKEDADMPDFERIQPSMVVTPIPDNLQKAILQMLKGGVVNLNEFTAEAEAIDYEPAEEEPAPDELSPIARPHSRRSGL